MGRVDGWDLFFCSWSKLEKWCSNSCEVSTSQGSAKDLRATGSGHSSLGALAHSRHTSSSHICSGGFVFSQSWHCRYVAKRISRALLMSPATRTIALLDGSRRHMMIPRRVGRSTDSSRSGAHAETVIDEGPNRTTTSGGSPAAKNVAPPGPTSCWIGSGRCAARNATQCS